MLLPLALRPTVFAAILLQTTWSVAADGYMLETIRPPVSVRAIALDPDGFLWLGGLRSLSRFDGVNNTQEIEGLPLELGPWVLGLAAAENGDFYAGIGDSVERLPAPGQVEGETFHTPGLLFRRTKGQWTPALPGEPYRRFNLSGIVATRTALWIVNETGLTRIRNGAIESFSPKAELGSIELTVVAASHGDAVWVGSGSGLGLFDNGTFRAIPVPDLSGPIVAIARGPDNTLWVADSASIFRIRENGESLERFSTKALLHTVPALHKFRLLSARDGSLWIGTAEGLLHTDKVGRVLARYGLDNGMSDARVLSLWEDPSGGIWAGTHRGGVLRLRPRRVQVGDSSIPWPAPTAVTTVEPDGTVWMAGEMGISWRAESSNFVEVPNPVAIPNAPISSMTPATQGSVWLATLGQGLQHVSRTSRSAVQARGLARDARISLVWNGGQRGIWVGLEDGTLMRFRDSAALLEPSAAPVETHAPSDSMCSGIPRNAAASSNGGVWVALEGGGIAQVNNGHASCVFPARDHNLGAVSSVFEDSDGTLYIGRTNDGGLLVKQGNRWTSFTVDDGLHCDTIHEIIDNGRGQLWLACAGGIQQVSKAALSAKADGLTPMLPAIAITEADGLRGTGTAAQVHPVLARGRTGGLWMASTRGAAFIIDRPADAQLARPVVVTAMRVNGKVVDTGPPIVIRGRSANIEFRHAIPTLETPDRNAFGYLLQGHDKTWQRGNPFSSQLLYTDLGPGKYQMRWLASDGNGNWLKQETRIDFSIELPMTVRPSFWMLVSLSLVIVVVFAYGVRLRKIRARYQMIHGERARIARDLHDLIGQSFSSIGFQLDAARRVARTEDGNPTVLLDAARETVAQAKKDLRRAIWDLRTERIDVPPLPEALKEVVTMHNGRLRGNAPRLTLTTTGKRLPRSALHEFEMVQIADEAIWNCIKHSNATEVQILLSVDDSNVVLQIIDNGTGIISTEKAGHFGIVGMYERAQRIGGTMAIGPVEPSGTVVRLDVPLSEWMGKRQ